METTEASKIFIENEGISWQQIDDSVRRKIMCFDDRVMLVKVEFRQGGIGSLHQHPHTQISHIESGVFEVEIGGDKKVLKAGDCFYVPPNVLHGVVCMEAGLLVDVFSPMREDFIETK